MNRFLSGLAFPVLMILLAGYGNAVKAETMRNQDASTMNLRYLALGDSYTIGESVSEKERWPVQLVSGLKDDGFSFDEVKIIAKTGWTTDELIQGIADVGPDGEYDLVSLLIGVNNQYRGRSVDEFRQEFITLLDSAVVYAGSNKDRVFVVSIPDWGVTPFAADRDTSKIASEIDHFNAVKEEICTQQGILYIPITDISREAESQPELLAADGLHPSGKMYGRWVDERIEQKIIQLLR